MRPAGAAAILSGALLCASAAAADAQAVLSDQRDALAHTVNAAIAREHCALQVNEAMLNAALTHVGLGRAELNAEPFSSVVAELREQAQASLAAAGAETVCNRLQRMYGVTGLRVPGLLTP